MINSQSQPLLNITLVLKFCAKNYKVNLVVKLKIKKKKFGQPWLNYGHGSTIFNILLQKNKQYSIYFNQTAM
jgi:hypothetical protein